MREKLAGFPDKGIVTDIASEEIGLNSEKLLHKTGSSQELSTVTESPNAGLEILFVDPASEDFYY